MSRPDHDSSEKRSLDASREPQHLLQDEDLEPLGLETSSKPDQFSDAGSPARERRVHQPRDQGTPTTIPLHIHRDSAWEKAQHRCKEWNQAQMMLQARHPRTGCRRRCTECDSRTKSKPWQQQLHCPIRVRIKRHHVYSLALHIRGDTEIEGRRQTIGYRESTYKDFLNDSLEVDVMHIHMDKMVTYIWVSTRSGRCVSYHTDTGTK